ncbi:MAG: Ig-like domain-containing protein [bacterium]
MKNWRKVLFSGLFILALAFAGKFAMAQAVDSSGLYGGVDQKTELNTTFSRFMGSGDPRIIAARLIQVTLGFLGLIAVGLIMYAGWLYMTANGEEKKMEDAKRILKNAGIGLVIILSAFAIAAYIIDSLIGATGLNSEGTGGGTFGYAAGGGGGGFYVAYTAPRNLEENVFINDKPSFEFNLDVSADAVSTSSFTFLKKRNYYLKGSERQISSTTDFVDCTVNCDVPFSVATSTYRVVSLVANATCAYFNGSATTTYEHCLEPWAQYQFEAKASLITPSGLSLQCTAQNPCLITFTTNDSLDIGRPVITSMSPAGGFCRDSSDVAIVSEACLITDDCQHWNADHTTAADPKNSCDTNTPNSAAGNLITFAGRNFGNVAGSVFVIASSSVVKINHPATSSTPAYTEITDDWTGAVEATTTIVECPAAWTDTEVTIKMPAGFTLGSTTAFKIVENTTANKWYDSTEDRFGPNIKRLVVNDIVRPGLCSLTPNYGTSTAPFTYKGLNLLDAVASTTGYFGAVLNRTLAYRGVFTNNTTNIDGFVPSVRPGTSTVFALRGKTYGNYLSFFKIPEVYTGPRITGFTPTAGKSGQYITISGMGFGYASKAQLLGPKFGVFFATSSDDGIEASYEFPDICSDNLWTDKQIIVKAPVGLTNGTAYTLRLIFPDSVATSTFYNIISQAYIVNNAEADLNGDNTVNVKSIKKQFTFNTAAKLSPGLCKMSPTVGQVGDSVTLSGEYFPFSTSTGNVIFQRLATSSSATVFSSLGNASSAVASVPQKAESGQVRVFHSTNGYSNDLAFKVGTCEPKTSPSAECGSTADWFCCPNGSSFAKTCRQASSTATDKLQDACFTSIKLSAFEWSFSTELDTLKATCSGYTNFNACMLSASCPNTPGSCQTGNGGEHGDCTDTYCNTKYSECGGDCEYDVANNRCFLKGKTCNTTVDLSGAKYGYYNADGVDPLSKFNTTSGLTIESEGPNKVYAVSGQGHWYTFSDYIPVDTTRSYYIAGRFKAMGTKSAHTYLGFDTYDKDKVSISAWQVIRYGSPVTITSMLGDTITVDGSFAGWNGAGSVAGNRSLAFYYDGDTTKLPKDTDIYKDIFEPAITSAYAWTTAGYYDLDVTNGAYNALIGNQIKLNAPALPPAFPVIPNVTKVMNHSSGGTFLYTAASGQDAPTTWTNFTGFINGEAFGNGINNFRPTTRFVKLIVGLNYMSPGDADPSGYKEYMDDVIFTPTMCSSVGGKGVSQIDVQGKSCLIGTFLDINGKCTIGTPLVPKLCSICGDGLSCNNNKCIVDKPVCEGDTKCTAGKCVADFTCECCCKVGNEAQDCCTGLTCTGGLCANDQKDAGSKFIYGQCTGCKVMVGGSYDQAASDLACNCKPGTAERVCNIDEKVFLNGEWKDNPSGICVDAAQEDQPCSAIAAADSTTNSSNSYISTSSVDIGYWMSSGIIAGYSQFKDNPVGTKFMFVDTPRTCSVLNATSTINGKTATCLGVPGDYYWVFTDKSPCPDDSFMSTLSGEANSFCLVASTTLNRMPKVCAFYGATSTVKKAIGGTDLSEVTCEKVSAWQKPFVTQQVKSTTTATTTYAKGPMIGNTVYHWQTDLAAGCPVGTYLDNNGKCTVGQLSDLAKCTPVGSIKGGMITNSTSTCQAVAGLPVGTGYWMIPKAPNKFCPVNTSLSATSPSADTKPWCIIGAKDSSYLKITASNLALCDSKNIGAATTSAGKNYTCTKVSYAGSHALGADGLCTNASLPACAPGLFCDPNGCSCQPVATSTAISEVRAGELCIDTGAGAQCLVGADSCDSGYTNLSCLTNPLAVNKDCRCCCTPGTTKTVKDIQNNDKVLKCEADKGSCSGASRGLFCGCATDAECNGGADSCDLETCCRARPFGTSTFPNNNSNNVCRNTVISMEFNEPMNPGSFAGNVIVVADNDSAACPTGSYLTTIKGHSYSWLERIFMFARRIFNISDTAYAEIGHNYCTVDGVVTMTNANKKVEFAPKNLLDGGKKYYVIIRGDAVQNDALHEGVLSAINTGIHDTDGGSGTVLLTPGYAESKDVFNVIEYFGYVWKFTTLNDASDNKGVCLLDHITIDTDGRGGQSWLFKNLKKDKNDDKILPPNSSFDSNNNDNDKVYYGRTFDKNNKPITSIAGVYSWSWSWSSSNVGVVTIGDGATYDLASNASSQQIMAVDGTPDRQTLVNASTTIDVDAINGTVGQFKTANALARIFICNNPWPPILSLATWPWKDGNANCGFNNLVKCDNNQFEFYYCRDNGGTIDSDYPAVNNTSAPIGGLAKGMCDAGYKNKLDCTASSDCNAPAGVKTCVNNICSGGGVGGNCSSDQDCQTGGTCRQVYKEFYFMRDLLPDASALNLTAMPEAKGSALTLNWTSDLLAGGYKIYYGVASKKYGPPIVIKGGVQSSYVFKDLINTNKYYFTVTKLSADTGAESKPAAEVSAVVADTWPPNAPINLKGTREADGSAIISWDNNLVDNNGDAVKFKVYYVASGTDLMSDYAASLAVSKNNSGKYSLKINSTYLNKDVSYKFAVTAIDSAGNESEKISTCNIMCGLAGACSLSCVWTKDGGAINTFGDLNGNGIIDSLANAVVYDNNANYTTANDVPNGQYLKLSGIQPTPYAWLADTNAAKVIKFRVTNGPKKICALNPVNGLSSCSIDNAFQEKIGQSLGEFDSGGGLPSRTAVNVETSDVWVHNRSQQTVSQITNEGVILRTCFTDPAHTGGANGGGVTLDKDGNAWAANMYTGDITLFSATATPGVCTILNHVNIGKQIYGLAGDSKGYLWVQSCPWCSTGQVTKINTNLTPPTPEYFNFSGGAIYGVTIDSSDTPWFGIYSGSGGVYRYKKATNEVKYYPFAGFVSGVSSDSYGRIWGSGFANKDIVGLNYNSTTDVVSKLYTISIGTTEMHGISGTSDGLVFSIAYPEAGASRIYFVDAATGQTTSSQLDRGTNVFCAKTADNSGLSSSPGGCLGSFVYTYADMAGLNRAKIMRSGTWLSEVMDHGSAGGKWGSISWDQFIKPGSNSSVEVYVAANDNPALLDGSMFIASDWNATGYLDANHMGRYLKIKVVLKSNDTGVTPVVSNIRIK